MKKITFLALLSVLTLSSIAQNKFGYIDSQELLTLMPERVAASFIVWVVFIYVIMYFRQI